MEDRACAATANEYELVPGAVPLRFPTGVGIDAIEGTSPEPDDKRCSADDAAAGTATVPDDPTGMSMEGTALEPADKSCIAIAKQHGNTSEKHYKIIIVGESGLGKTTATECLLQDLRVDSIGPSLSRTGVAPKTAKITTSDPIGLRCDSERDKLYLRIVDTPGYGDNLDATDDFRKIKDFIASQYDNLYGAVVMDGKDAHSYDALVTCCLYFIAPHRIKDNDIRFMMEVSKMVSFSPYLK